MAFFGPKRKNIQYDTLDTEEIVAKPVKTMQTGMKMVVFKYGEKRLQVQTPEMPQAFDVNENKSDSGRISYSTNLSFRYDQEEEKVNEFREFLEKIDEFNLNFATKNSQELFGKKMKKEIVDEFHKPIVRWPKNDQYRPTLKVKLPFRDGIPDFQVYGTEGEQYEIYNPETTETSLDKVFVAKAQSVYLIEYTGIWVIGKQFGAGWKLVQAKVNSEPTFQNCAIVDDTDSDDDEDGDEEGGPGLVDDADTADF